MGMNIRKVPLLRLTYNETTELANPSLHVLGVFSAKCSKEQFQPAHHLQVRREVAGKGEASSDHLGEGSWGSLPLQLLWEALGYVRCRELRDVDSVGKESASAEL